MWLAAHLADSKNPANWARAAQIESGDARYWNQMALYQEWDFEHGNVQQAIRYFQRAGRLNPHSPTIWADLASAYEVAGEPEQARRNYEKARAVAPVSAEVAWQYGSFLLRQGETQEAAVQIRKA
jgi:Tfp pilus assembly protein PilF